MIRRSKSEKLRRAGLAISADYDSRKSDSRGKHGRYPLETPVMVVEGSAL
jgi:hypothetical protein